MMMDSMKRLTLLMTLFLVLVTSAAQAETGRVYVSIAPLHALVQGVMGTTAQAELLIKPIYSPHDFQLRPSQIRGLKKADLIFLIGPTFEISAQKAVTALGLQRQTVQMMHLPALTILANRVGGAWGGVHDHESDVDGQELSYAMKDPHIWLNPANAVTMVREIANRLSKIYPEHTAEYTVNSAKLINKIKQMDGDLALKLQAVKNIPFVVFHDAYQYFETYYNLNAVGAILLDPTRVPSIGRIKEMRAQISTTGARCAFREPQFSGKLVDVVLAGSSARAGILDPVGQGLAVGEGLYVKLMTALADTLITCLQKQ